ncbi:hypothetical protein Hypma_000660 [Hypsizygus marmoreus]|uniref:Uncharacterized protein n=1 Tax=Hypsizygus marmoreus TaxID=39966 RepID=A0A369JAM7_HYPMA|nr:hypothetical protein Hypma_000660 [Hypsizygus marmoreus]
MAEATHPPDGDDNILRHLQLQYPEPEVSQEIPSEEETASYASQFLNVVLHDDGPTPHSLLTETTITPSHYPVTEDILIQEIPGMGTAANSDNGKRKYIDDSHHEELDNSRKNQLSGSSKRLKIDYLDTSGSHNKGTDYFALSLRQLQIDFPRIPESYLRPKLKSFRSFYSPTHLYLLKEEKRHKEQLRNKQKIVLPYVPNVTPLEPGYNGKGRALYDADFDQERAWLLQEMERHERLTVIDGIDGMSNDSGLQMEVTGGGTSTGQGSDGDASVEVNWTLPKAATNSIKTTESAYIDQDHDETYMQPKEIAHEDRWQGAGEGREVKGGYCNKSFHSGKTIPCSKEHLSCVDSLNKHAANVVITGNSNIKCIPMGETWSTHQISIGGAGTGGNNGKCQRWRGTDEKDTIQVPKAGARALQEHGKFNPDLNTRAIAADVEIDSNPQPVDVPSQRAVPPPSLAHRPTPRPLPPPMPISRPAPTPNLHVAYRVSPVHHQLIGSITSLQGEEQRLVQRLDEFLCAMRSTPCSGGIDYWQVTMYGGPLLNIQNRLNEIRGELGHLLKVLQHNGGSIIYV